MKNTCAESSTAKKIGMGVMLNLYPDSIGGKLGALTNLLEREEMQDVFRSIYILPSLYRTDLDRGFSVIDYEINGEIATRDDVEKIKSMGIDLKLDFILNHLSMGSPQFRDLLENGSESKYRDFFIDWNAFWEGCGEMTEEGYIQPDPELIKDMFFRKPGLPILMVEFPDGKKVPYWNTFYQQVTTDEDGTKHYLGQMDLNIQSPVVWEHYEETLQKLASYGAKIVRLDAFAYAPKAPGRRNFLNEPETWDLLAKIREIAEKYGVTLLPEIHATYGEGTYRKLAELGYPVYDFFLPGLIIEALDAKDGKYLEKWANETIENGIHTVNMLGCHDGIPLLDLKGLLPEDRIDEVIEVMKERGGFVKDLFAEKKLYYQVNMGYYNAVGGTPEQLLMARAIQLFMPGKPQVWYRDLFAGKSDRNSVDMSVPNAYKEINRENYTVEDIEEALGQEVVKKQLELLRLRNTHPAFAEDATVSVKSEGSMLTITWKTKENEIRLQADLATCEYQID